MVQVTKEQFYSVCNDLDICIYSKWNNITQKMTTDFKFRSGKMFGIAITEYDTELDNYGEVIYHIVEEYSPLKVAT